MVTNSVDIEAGLQVGNDMYFVGEFLPMTIQARDDRFIIVTRKLHRRHDANLLHFKVEMQAYLTFTQAYNDLKNEIVYSILDLQDRKKAPDNYGGFYDYKSPANCERAIKHLNSGKIELSKRHGVNLQIDYERTLVKPKK